MLPVFPVVICSSRREWHAEACGSRLFLELDLKPCFVTSEAPFRFPEVILVPIEPQKRDLQLWNWPRASTKQGGCLFGTFLQKVGGFGTLFCHQ